jgi:replicative DNA helicase
MNDFESAVVACAMLDAKSFWRVADILRPEHFRDGELASLWSAISANARADRPFDLLTMSDSHGRGVLEIANGEYRMGVVRSYAERIVDAYVARSVETAGHRITLLEGSGTERLAEAQRIVRDINTGVAEVRTAQALMREVVQDMQRQANDKRALTGLTTGWRHFDAWTSGLMPGTLNIVAGRPSMGKSVFGMQIGMHAAINGHGVHIASLEMSAEACMKRLISAESRVPFEHVKNATNIEDEEWPRVFDASTRLANAPLTIDDQAFSLDAICARIRQQSMSRGIALAVIDYLGYMDLPKGERQDLRVQEATRALKRLAKELQIPIVLIAQLNRGVEGRQNRRPGMSDLRDSGAIEQDADLICLLHREDYYDKDSHLAGFAELIVAKQRDGKTGTLPMKHRFDVMRFEEAEELPNEPHQPTQERGFAKRFGRSAA